MKITARLIQIAIVAALGVGLVTGAFAKSKQPTADRSSTLQSAPATDKAVQWQKADRSTIVSKPSGSDAPLQTTMPITETVPVANPEQGPSALPRDVAAYEVTWSTVNAGSTPMTSASYDVESSVGQSAVGFTSSVTYEAGIGYWYGVEGGGGGCHCPFQGDMNADGVPDAIDLNALIDALFFGGANPQDPTCPTTRADVNADDVPDAVDLNYVIDWLFFGGPAPIDPCEG